MTKAVDVRTHVSPTTASGWISHAVDYQQFQNNSTATKPDCLNSHERYSESYLNRQAQHTLKTHGHFAHFHWSNLDRCENYHRNVLKIGDYHFDENGIMPFANNSRSWSSMSAFIF
tara:strand:+ start:159 stop:506 length:348 start_codon:yes stop_codon:yes gene_type:complete